MQRRCPSGVPNVYGATLVVLLLLLAVLVGEAFWSWRTSEEPEEKDLGQDEVIRRRPALQIFRSGFSCSCKDVQCSWVFGCGVCR